MSCGKHTEYLGSVSSCAQMDAVHVVPTYLKKYAQDFTAEETRAILNDFGQAFAAAAICLAPSC